jgi:LPS export ABC transporter permease LptG/LPS export ABC transporter permease LptF
MLRLIDRYLIREILAPLALGLVVFTFILEIPPILTTLERLVAKGVDWIDVARIIWTLIPQGLGVTIPVAVLLGLLIALGRLSADREMVALQACGVSLGRLVRPVMLVGTVAAAATAYVMIKAIPDANQTFREITYRIVTARVENDVRPRVFFDDFPGKVLYVGDIDPAGGWRDVLLADTGQPGQPGHPTVYTANRGRLLLDAERRRVDLLLEDGASHKVDAAAPEKDEWATFGRLSLQLDPESVFPREGPQRGLNEMSIADLRTEVARIETAGQSPHNAIMAIHQKFSFPVACLVFAIIGLGLGVSNRKDGKFASMVLGLSVVFVYYAIFVVAEALTKGQILNAVLARWVPNVVLGAAGIALLIWRGRSTEGSLTLSLPIRRGSPAEQTGPASASPARGRRVVVVIRIPQLRLPGPGIVDRYVVGIYLRIFALAFAGLLGLFYIGTIVDLSEKVFKGQATGEILFSYLVFRTPQFIYFVLPIAALIATLVSVGLLTKNSELVVMRACGISLYRTAMPLLVAGLAWSGVIFALEESILASANQRAEQLQDIARGRGPRTQELDRNWISGRDGRVYHYRYFDSARSELHGLTIFELTPGAQRLARRTYATRATFRDGEWHGTRTWTREPAVPKSYRAAERQTLAIEPPDYFSTELPDPDRMTYTQLRRYIDALRTGGFSVTQYVVALHRKLSFPLVTVIMTLIAVPFAVTTGRRGALYGIGAGIALALAYWILISAFAAIGSAGLLPAMLAAWAPNILFAIAAAYLLLTVRT